MKIIIICLLLISLMVATKTENAISQSGGCTYECSYRMHVWESFNGWYFQCPSPVGNWHCDLISTFNCVNCQSVGGSIGGIE